MQCISVAFVEVNSVKFAYSAGIEDQIYNNFAETLMCLSVKGTVLTNQMPIQSSVKAHEVTRCVSRRLNRT